MIRLFIVVMLGAFSAAMPAMAGEVTAEALAAIDKVLADIGCKVEADDVDATDDG